MIVHKKFLGDKKESFTISISKTTKDYFLRYQKKNASLFENENDDRFKNISTLIDFILKECMEALLSGKSLDDFKHFKSEPDKKVKDFYEKITVRVGPEQYNNQIEPHRYFELDTNFESIFLIFRDFLIREKFYEDFIYMKILSVLNRFKNFLLGNKLTEYFDTFFDDNLLVIEYRGTYTNIHYEYSKGICGLMGFLGLELNKFVYHDKYSRLSFNLTPLVKTKKLKLKEREKLSKENEIKFFDFSKILDDKNYHLWIRLSKNDKSLISFLDINSGKEYILNIIKNLKDLSRTRKLDEQNFIKRYLLRMFEIFGWITINDWENNLFDINITKKNHYIDFNILINFFDFIKETNH